MSSNNGGNHARPIKVPDHWGRQYWTNHEYMTKVAVAEKHNNAGITRIVKVRPK